MLRDLGTCLAALSSDLIRSPLPFCDLTKLPSSVLVSPRPYRKSKPRLDYPDSEAPYDLGCGKIRWLARVPEFCAAREFTVLCSRAMASAILVLLVQYEYSTTALVLVRVRTKYSRAVDSVRGAAVPRRSHIEPTRH